MPSQSSIPHPPSTHASVEQDIDGRLRLLRHRALHEYEPNGDQRTDGVTDVIAAVGEAAERGRHHLKRREQARHLGLFRTGEVTEFPRRLWREEGSGQVRRGERLSDVRKVTKFSRRL